MRARLCSVFSKNVQSQPNLSAATGSAAGPAGLVEAASAAGVGVSAAAAGTERHVRTSRTNAHTTTGAMGREAWKKPLMVARSGCKCSPTSPERERGVRLDPSLALRAGGSEFYSSEQRSLAWAAGARATATAGH